MRGVGGEETDLPNFGVDDDARGAAGIHDGGCGSGSEGWSDEESPEIATTKEGAGLPREGVGFWGQNFSFRGRWIVLLRILQIAPHSFIKYHSAYLCFTTFQF